MKKKLLFFSTLVLAIASLICAFSISVSAEEAATPSVSIDKFNLVFEDNVYLKYAVKFDGVDDGDINSSNIGMLYFTAPQDDYTKGGEAYSSSVVGYTTIQGEKYYTFEYRHITAKQMTDYIYSVAYIDIDGERIYSTPVKYSVLDYCYSKLGKTGVASENEDFKTLLAMTLEQGAAAQKYFKYNTDRLANDEYYLVEVVGGTLEDGFTKGLYHEGETATLIAEDRTNTVVFDHWENDAHDAISFSSVHTVTSHNKNIVFAAIYTPYLSYSKGLEFRNNLYQTTYYVRGTAECKDIDLILPNITIDGEVVTKIGGHGFQENNYIENIYIAEGIQSIDNQAFYYCENIKTVYIPSTLSYIGKWVFYGCSNITNVIIPQNSQLVTIEEFAFRNCSKLKEIVLPQTALVSYGAFYNCSNLEKVFFEGTKNQWSSVIRGDYNQDLKNATRYYYSENHPTEEGNFWHWVDGVPTIWE